MTTKNVTDYREFLSKPEISFWVPIISSVMMIAFSWFNLSSRVELLTQKVDNLIEQNEKLLIKYSDVERRWGDVSQRVTVLETRAGLR